MNVHYLLQISIACCHRQISRRHLCYFEDLLGVVTGDSSTHQNLLNTSCHRDCIKGTHYTRHRHLHQATMRYSLVLASLVCGTIGSILIVVGASTFQWFTFDDRYTVGLFTLCLPTRCAWYIAGIDVSAARTLLFFGMVQSAAGAIVLIAYTVKHLSKNTTHKVLAMVATILFISAAAAALIGSIIFATSRFSVHFRLGYSFALTIVGTVATGAAGVLALIHRIRLQNE